ncbi:peptidoglycan-binding domain-containing protein [Streptomyces lycii]|uniref:Peptidoglycan binding-like domain-containing protein n=2 Tax=Streptomyces TaxID=1883 RepID=A0ABQ7FRV0_9ACTN|nr:hypothetical protein GCU69_00645 [Streptomyces lycii]
MYSDYAYWLDEDGIHGSKTKAAVGYVQRCNGTTGGVDHIVGPSTWSRLYSRKAGCAF